MPDLDVVSIHNFWRRFRSQETIIQRDRYAGTQAEGSLIINQKPRHC